MENRASTPLAPKHDRVAIVVNGNAKQVTEELVETLDQIVQSGDLYVSRSLEEGREIARTIVSRGYPTVLTGGGDGTFVQVVTWVTAEATAQGKEWPQFGFLRLGTGNALAWVLGAGNAPGKGVVADLAKIRGTAGSRELRLLEVEGTLTPFAGLGVDSIALQHHEQTKAWMQRTPVLKNLASAQVTYATSITTRSLPEFLFRPHPRVRIVNEGETAYLLGKDDKIARAFERGETIYEGPARMAAFSTIPYWGLGARMFPFADERHDRFQLRVSDITSWQVVRHFGALFDGTYRGDTMTDFLCESISVHYEETIPLQIGGDLAGERTRVDVRLCPRPIRVIDFYSPPQR